MDNPKVPIVVQCIHCKKNFNIEVYLNDYEEYTSYSYKPIHKLFPYLTPGERELLISNTCDSCWDDIFGHEDEDEEYDEDENNEDGDSGVILSSLL